MYHYRTICRKHRINPIPLSLFQTNLVNVNAEDESNNDLGAKHTPNNIYIDSDTNIVHYSNNTDVYAKPIPKSERNKPNNIENSENTELIDNCVYEGGDIYAEPNHKIGDNRDNTDNDEYSYVYADHVRPLANVAKNKNDKYGVINKKGKVTNKSNVEEDNAGYAYIAANIKNANETTKGYVNSNNGGDYLHNIKENQNETYSNINDEYYTNPTKL